MSACQETNCNRPSCRRVAHHGLHALVACPKCRHAAPLAELDTESHRDWSHAAGVTCFRCGFYFLPPDMPEKLLALLADWERPVPNRPPADIPAMRARLRPRMLAWRRAGNVAPVQADI